MNQEVIVETTEEIDTTPPSNEKPAKPAKKTRVPKEPKEPKEPSVKRSKFELMYPGSAAITVLVDKNPKKVGSKSYERFEGYRGAATIAEALAAGVTYQDIAYDVGRQFISVC